MPAFKEVTPLLHGKKIMIRLAIILVLYTVVFSGQSAATEGSSATLARLSFWMPPERMEDFKTAYQEQIAPILERHGLVASAQRGRATADSVFSRLFVLDNPSAVAATADSVDGDPEWVTTMRRLGEAFGTQDPDGRIRIAVAHLIGDEIDTVIQRLRDLLLTRV